MNGRRAAPWLCALTWTVLASCGGTTPDAPPEPPALLQGVVMPSGFWGDSVAATAPGDNPLTESRAQLGKRLFFDKRLSRTGEVACASCHHQRHGFADPHPVSEGVEGRKGKRNAPALVNLAWSESLFWDGRTRSLEEQAGKPIEDPLEMDLPLPQAVARLRAEPSYLTAFKEAYDGLPDEVTLSKALASFVRTLVSGQSPYDRHLRGEAAALGPRERRGLDIFFGGKGQCFHCHPPNVLTNEGYFNNGSYSGNEGEDPGRQLLTMRTGDLGKFKVPGLRNVAASAPYMHDGSVATLEELVDQYARGGRGHESTDPLIHHLELTAEEKADLVAFLHALTDDTFLRDPRFHP
jgi:cytochrome c peroxidase